jgi:hypothetical protein
MDSSISERDWKKFKSIKDTLLDTACERILEKIKALIEEGNGHRTYLQLWKVIRQEDAKIAEMFDDLKRSNALFKIAVLVRNDLINEETLKEFSAETQERVRSINQM